MYELITDVDSILTHARNEYNFVITDAYEMNDEGPNSTRDAH